MDKDMAEQLMSIAQGIETCFFYTVMSANGAHRLDGEYLASPEAQEKLKALRRFGSDLAEYVSQLVKDGEFDNGEEQEEEN